MSRIKEQRRKDRLVIFSFFVLLFVVVGVRLLIIGGPNECFWAEDTGVCLSILNSRN